MRPSLAQALTKNKQFFFIDGIGVCDRAIILGHKTMLPKEIIPHYEYFSWIPL